MKASRIKSTRKKNSGKSRKNKKVKAGEDDGGNVGEFEEVAVHVLADEGTERKKRKIKRADSNTGEGVTVAVNVAAEGKKTRKKKNKRAESTAGVEGVVAGDDVVAVDDVAVGDDLVAGGDVAYDDDVVAGGDVAYDDDVVGGDDDVTYDDDVVGGDDDVVVFDIEAGEGATVLVADEGKRMENKRAGSNVKGVVAGEGLGVTGKKRKKPSWEYVPIVAEVEEQLPPKRRRPPKKNEDFVTY